MSSSKVDASSAASTSAYSTAYNETLRKLFLDEIIRDQIPDEFEIHVFRSEDFMIYVVTTEGGGHPDDTCLIFPNGDGTIPDIKVYCQKLVDGDHGALVIPVYPMCLSVNSTNFDVLTNTKEYTDTKELKMVFSQESRVQFLKIQTNWGYATFRSDNYENLRNKIVNKFVTLFIEIMCIDNDLNTHCITTVCACGQGIPFGVQAAFMLDTVVKVCFVDLDTVEVTSSGMFGDTVYYTSAIKNDTFVTLMSLILYRVKTCIVSYYNKMKWITAYKSQNIDDYHIMQRDIEKITSFVQKNFDDFEVLVKSK